MTKRVKAWAVVWGNNRTVYSPIRGTIKTEPNWHYPHKGGEQMIIMYTREEARKYAVKNNFCFYKVVPCEIVIKEEK